MRTISLFIFSLLLLSCFDASSQKEGDSLPDRIAGSHRISSPRMGKGLRTHLWVPFQVNGQYITFESAPQLSVQVVGLGKTANGAPFHFSVKIEKIKSENDGFSLTLLSSEFPVDSVDYVDVNYLAMTDCKGAGCVSQPPCGSCCLL